MMGDLIKELKGNVSFFVACAIDKKVDGREIGKNIDREADEQFGGVSSEKIQRGPVTNLFLEIIEGLHDEDKGILIKRAETWVSDLKRTKNEGGD